MEGHERVWRVWQERFAWLTPHWIVYGFVGGVMAIAYHAAGLYALAVFAVPLLLMRKTQEAYLRHTQKSAQKLRAAAETIQSQNVSLEQANRLLKERSTAAMESLSATVDARDAYTAGHSRRVQQLALAIGRELGSRRRSSTCSDTRRSSTTSASSPCPTRSCSSRQSSPTTSGRSCSGTRTRARASSTGSAS